MSRRVGLWINVTAVGLITWVGAAHAADLYFDTSAAPGLQGGNGAIAGTNFSADISGVSLVTLSGGDSLFFRVDSATSYDFGLGVSQTCGAWTVANTNVVTCRVTADAGCTLAFNGGITVQDRSLMQWDMTNFVLAGTPFLTVQGDSTNVFNSNHGLAKTLNYGALTFGAGNNVLQAIDGTDTLNLTFTGLSGGIDDLINLGGGGKTTLTITNTDSSSFSGQIVGMGTVVKKGTGSLLLSGTNTFNGGLVVDGGTLQLAGSNALGAGTLTMSGGAVSSDGATERTIVNNVKVNRDSTFGNSSNNGRLTVAGTVDFNSATQIITVASDVVFSGNVTNGSLSKTGAGTLTLKGNVVVVGTTEIHGGILLLDGGAVVSQGAFRPDVIVAGDTARIIVTNGASLKIGANSSIRVGYDGAAVGSNIYDIAGAVTATNSGAEGMILRKNGAANIANLLSNGIMTVNSVVVDGAGVNNTFFNFDGGILRAGMSDSGFMTGIGEVRVQGGGAVIDSAGFDITVAQNLLDGGGGLTKLGAGSLKLSKTNTFTGPVTINEGTLVITNASALSATTNIVLNAGSLVATNVPGVFHVPTNCVISGLNGAFLVTNLVLDPGSVISPGGPGVIGTNTLGSTSNDIVGVNGVYEMDFSGTLPATCDRIVAIGSLDLTGMTISFADSSVYEEGVDYVIATYGGSVTMPAALRTIPTAQSSRWRLRDDPAMKQVILRCPYGGTVLYVR